MIKAIIVDDEFGARQTLSGMLKLFIKNVQIVGEAVNAREARVLLKEKQPDLVFLDINMPYESGFDFLESLEERNFKVIFITAYDAYAIRAFKFSALDYLLKPINVTELENAILRIDSMKSTVDQFKVLKAHRDDDSDRKIVLPFKEGFKVVDCKEIVRFEGNRNYSWVHFVNGGKILVSKTLKEFEDLFSNHSFFRIHQSNLINLDCVRQYNKGRGGTIELIDGSVVSVARSKKQLFLELFK